MLFENEFSQLCDSNWIWVTQNFLTFDTRRGRHLKRELKLRRDLLLLHSGFSMVRSCMVGYHVHGILQEPLTQGPDYGHNFEKRTWYLHSEMTPHLLVARHAATRVSVYEYLGPNEAASVEGDVAEA